MTKDFEFVRALTKGNVYRISDPACLTAENIKKLPWTEETWGFSFILPEHQPVSLQILSEQLSNYGITVEYELKKKDLKVVSPSGISTGVSLEPIVTPKEHHDLFVSTYAAYFWAEWPEAVDSHALTMIGDFLDKVLPSAYGAKILKDGVLSGMITYFPKKDENGLPIDWIGWIWIARTLSAEERKDAQHKICLLIQKFKCDRVRCAVRSWNTRSHGFFKKLGFTSKSVTVLKKR